MERVTKMLMILTVFLVVFTLDVEGGRSLKEKEKVDHPQNFFGGIGGGSFPSSPGFGGSIPSPGFGGSIPSPDFAFGSFCSFTGVGCVPVLPTNPGGSIGGGLPGGSIGSP